MSQPPYVRQANTFSVAPDGDWFKQSIRDGEVVSEERGTGYWGPRVEARCRVYWGSHGCMLERDHEGEHLCSCTYENGVMLPHMDDDPEFGNVGRAPYYGPETSFYGEDA